jgi:hypothetical protein
MTCRNIGNHELIEVYLHRFSDSIAAIPARSLSLEADYAARRWRFSHR